MTIVAWHSMIDGRFFLCIICAAMLARYAGCEDMASVFPPALDSIARRNLPEQGRLKIKEINISSTGAARVSVFTLFFSDGAKTAGMEYQSSPLNARKKILLKNYGMDIWTLDSAAGRLRKIARHKKHESVNGTDFTYWEVLPSLLLDREYAVILDTLMPDGVRLLRLESTKWGFYKEIRLWVKAGDLCLDKIMFYGYNNKPVKEMVFSKAADREKSIFPFHSIILKNLKTGSQTEHQILAQDTVPEFPDDILNIPQVR